MSKFCNKLDYSYINCGTLISSLLELFLCLLFHVAKAWLIEFTSTFTMAKIVCKQKSRVKDSITKWPLGIHVLFMYFAAIQHLKYVIAR